MAGAPSRPLTVYIDRGGTFTDVVARIQGPGPERLRVLKLLSVDPAYADAPTEGIRRILEQETGVAHPRGVPLDTSRLAEIRMGTTVATNALLERAGERCALAVSAGFRDVLHIGTQSRPRIFDLEVVCPDVLYDSVVEVDELVSLPLGEGGSARDGPADGPRPELEGARCVGTTGEEVVIRKPVDVAAVTRDLQAVFDSGIRSLAVCLKHAALYPGHEHEVGAIAKSIGFTHVSLSSVVLPAVKMVPRGYTAMADAYLTPHIQRYLAAFTAGFDAGLSDGSVRLSFMQSDGGLARAAAFSGHRAILSGPAGGVVGFARTTRWGGGGGTDGDPAHMQVVGFDMGGTSTDVSRVARGLLEHVFESTTAGITIAAPQLDVNTVAAGGGSKLTFSNGALCVGPDSVGAHPGPVCYRKGGSLAVTDANLQLGRIVPAFFPRIFGKDEDQPLDGEATGAAFLAMADAVNAHQRALGDTHAMSVDEVAAGFVRVANEAMCRPIRALTNMRGFDPSAHVLACFGGAGGQHCCAIARALGMRTVFVHRFASVLSALGIGLAATVHEEREPAAQQLAPGPAGGAVFDARFSALEQAATGSLAAQGFPPDSISCERYLNLRYAGTDVAIMTPCPSADGDMSVAPGDYAAAFVARYKREFGFSLDRPLIVDDLRVRATAAGAASPDEAADTHGAVQPSNSALPEPSAWTSSFFEGAGRVRTPVFTLAALPRGSVVPGPALLVDDISTVVVEPGCSAHITAEGNIRIQVEATPAVGAHSSPDASEGAPPDPIQLSVFGHRFMGIAEQMGRTLQRTSVSVNIKERLDFSCALFGPDGGLVANAPHLPVHLGAMQEAVRFQLQHHAQAGVAPLVDGDVLVSNHPQLAGGSHLPDITVITPVFDTTPGGGGRLVFFVASRGHHADIGGISPGSMPPNSTSLAQEGAAIVSFKLVKEGVFQEEGISELLNAPASSSVPGCCGTRNLSDNLSDLRAQVAANQRGIALVRELIAEHSLRTVQAYMTHIRRAAERAVRAMLVRFSLAQGLPEVGTVRAVDYLDDGTPIHLAVTIDRATGGAVFDFSGTGPQVHGNLNAPPAVTYSAVIYALRCMVREEIPLNQGCLAPITLTIPDGSVLRPSATAAVVGGNVLTSQRVTDVVLRAFDAAAASQGCMNNLTFGDAALGYYETICGGAGAGPGFHGRSGVHTHMTNTRITDPEILERRYPVVLRAFRLRPHSGGAGAWSGGDGVVRELEVLRPLTVGILSERRALPPFGLHGGGDGQRGTNMWLQAQLPPGGAIPADVSAREVSLGGKATVLMQPGDRLRVLTPGGGGYGQPGKQQHSRAGAQPAFVPKLGGGSLDAFRRAQESV